MITILAIGKRHESWVAEGIGRYEKRLLKPYNARWVLLPHSAREGLAARQEESERLLSHLKAGEYVIVLDERGSELNSPAFARQLSEQFAVSHEVVVIIGGAYGVTDELRARANRVWSLSPLVFPHQLVRLILTEQLYRAQEIALGHPYHHD